MFREMISWIGLFTSNPETLKLILRKKEESNIFTYLRGLADETGYYDHLLQIVLHSFDFGVIGSPARDLLQHW